MEMEYDDLIRVWEHAFQMLYEKDKELFIADVQERAIADRLAIYLQHILDPNFKNEHRIDIEYNREGHDTKRRHPEDKKGWMVIIPGGSEPPVRTLRATIPEYGSHIFR